MVPIRKVLLVALLLTVFPIPAFGSIIGYSGQGRPIQSVEIAPAGYTKTMLITAGIHGYEDAWPRDGAEIVAIAKSIAAYYQQNPNKLNGYRLVVVPCVNPDGLIAGWTNNGPGRCQLSLKIDINRDFPYNFVVCTSSRNRTGSSPFSTPEALAVKNIIAQTTPDVLIDLHGWYGYTKGDRTIANYFNKALGIYTDTRVPAGQKPGQGQLIAWAQSIGIKSVLLEYPDPVTGRGRAKTYKTRPSQTRTKYFAQKTISALDDYFASAGSPAGTSNIIAMR